MDQLLLIAVLGAISSFSISGAWAAPSTAGFLYIDCGATTSQMDSVTGITWVPDAEYISTGVAFSNVPNASNFGFDELSTLRYFDNGRKKNCYTLPVIRNSTYLLRLSFYHGSYDGARTIPAFKVGIDTAIVATLTGLDYNVHHFREFTIQPQKNVTFVCLILDSPDSNPFISGISLRPVTVLPPRIKELLALNQTIFTARRRYFGSTEDVIRFPDDVHDRLWLSTPATASAYPLATSPIEILNTSDPVNMGVIQTAYLDPPLAVLRSAVTTSGNMTLKLSSITDIPSAVMVMYFAELDPSTNTTDRAFYIHVPDAKYMDRYENPANFSGLYSGDFWAYPDIEFTKDFSVVMYPSPSRTSLKGPTISAMEVSYTLGEAVLPTNDRDVLAIEAIKRHMNLMDWSGDPCLPYPYPWVTCSTTTSPEIVSVDLSKYNLTGTISKDFAGLLSLTSLALDNNKLVGPFPNLQPLTNLESLHLENNQLSGSIPEWLASSPRLIELSVQSNNFSGEIPANLISRQSSGLIFRHEANPLLGSTGLPSPSGTSSSSGSNIGIIIGAAVGGILALSVSMTGFILYCFYFRKRPHKDKPQPPAVVQKILSVGGARVFSFQEVVAATSNFACEVGRGGFGRVYYGSLSDGQEIAVKVLDKTSGQGSAEILNEVGILSRVHHKNLVSLVGYCEAKDNPMLILEFVHKGSLRDHLTGENSYSPEKLDWKTRIGIALDAAQGLEYLHTACKPSFIHRDVKSSNVLLTNKLGAKVADFGLSKLIEEEQLTHIMTQVKGTDGYLDPEYFTTQMLTPKTDVFSFGVVLLELLTGRLPYDPMRPKEERAHLCDWVRHALEAGKMEAILDPSIKASKPYFDALWKVADIAMQCVEPKGVHRPTMTKVVEELQIALHMIPPCLPKYSDNSNAPHIPSIPQAR